MDNIVTPGKEDERLETQAGRPQVRPTAYPSTITEMPPASPEEEALATAAPDEVPPEVLEDVPAPAALPIVPDSVPDLNYSELVLGGNPIYQLSPDLGNYSARQLAWLDQQNRQSFVDRLEQINPLNPIIFRTQPVLTDELNDPRFNLRLDNELLRNHRAFLNTQVPYNQSISTPPDPNDPRVPNSLRPTLPQTAPGADAMGARAQGNYNLPNQFTDNVIVNQATAFGRVIGDLYKDTFTPDDRQFNWEIDDFLSIGRNLVISPAVQGIAGAVSGNTSSFQERLPNASQSIPRFLDTIAPVENPTNAADPTVPYHFDPLRGYFGEYGRGLPGAAIYTLAAPGQLVAASLYSVSDLSRYLAGGETNLPTTGNRSEYHQPLYRFRQALAGQDLGFTNFRDGSGNRYLSAIPTDESTPTWQRWAWGGLGFIGDAVALGWVDDALYKGVRLTPAAIGDIGRGHSPTHALRAASRLDNIRSLRRTQGSVPNFNRVAQGNTPATPTTPVAEAQGLLSVDVMTPPVRRTNAQLAQLGQTTVTESGTPLVPPGVSLNNAQRAMMENVYGDVFARYGDDLTGLGEGTPLLSPDAATFDLKAYTEAVESVRRNLDEAAQTGVLNAEDVTQNVHRVLESNAPPVEVFVDEMLPSNMRAPVAEVRPYVESLDETMDAGRATRALEEGMSELHQNINKHARVFQENYSTLGRGHVMDELANLAQYGQDVPDLKLRLRDTGGVEPPPRMLDLPSTPIAKELQKTPWYHGSKANAELNAIHPDIGSSSNEFGSGLYLTNNPEMGDLYAKLGRSSTTPVTGGKRFTATGNLYTVVPDIRQPLLLNVRGNDSVRRAFTQAAADVFGTDEVTRRAYAKATRGTNVENYWLKLREVYAEANNAPISEVDFQAFSASVAQRLRNRGYDSLYHKSDVMGETLVVLDQPGTQLPVRVNGVQRGIGQGTSLEARQARNQADRLLALHFKNNKVAQAWELQSRIDMETSMLDELVAAHNDATRAGNIAASKLAELDTNLRRINRTTKTRMLETAQRQADEIAEVDAKPHLKIDTENPCL